MILFVAVLVQAKSKEKYIKDFPLKGKGEIQIINLDKEHKMLEVLSVKLPGEGSHWVKAKDLIAAGELNTTKNARLVGQIKSLKDELKCMKITISKNLDTFYKNEPAQAEKTQTPPPENINPCTKAT